MAKILVVEDDFEYADLVRTWLTHEHHTVEVAHTGTAASELLQAYEYDAIILDWDLPGMSGLDVCVAFRKSGGKTPIIMLTGKKSVDEKEAGLDSGADDYVAKPVHVKELSARVRALLRRASGVTSNVLKVKALSLDPKTFSVTRGDEDITLSKQEFALLEFFMRNPNHVFSPEALLERVWLSESEATPNAIRACMTRLRQKIDKDGEDSAIKTIHGVGYKLVP
jgi:two-component system response regulator MprA